MLDVHRLGFDHPPHETAVDLTTLLQTPQMTPTVLTLVPESTPLPAETAVLPAPPPLWIRVGLALAVSLGLLGGMLLLAGRQ